MKNITIPISVSNKNDSEYDVICKCLEYFGNTNLIKSELKYLPQLMSKYKLDVKHYDKIYRGEFDCEEDWIINWLDWR